MEDQSYQSLNPKRDARQRKWREFKSWAYLTAHGVFWDIMFGLRIGWTYSRWLCSMNLYRFFIDGRCMYCGIKHRKAQP